MAEKPPTHNGHDRLEEARANLITNQAAFLNHLAGADKRQADAEMRMAESERLWAAVQRETGERFARLEETNAAILRVLAEHSRMLERLPEALRDKIGFKVQDAK